MPADILQSCSWVSCPDFLRTKQLPFEQNTAVVDNIEPSVVTKEQDNDSTSFLAESATKTVKN